jgi:hypothetical protein
VKCEGGEGNFKKRRREAGQPGGILRMAALHSSVSLITSVEGSDCLLLRISLRYFA